MNSASLHSEQVSDRRVGVRCGETSAYRADPWATLREILIPYALIAAIVTTALAVTIGAGVAVALVNGEGCSHASTVRKNDLPAILTGLKTYRLQTGGYPSGSEGLQALVSASIVDRAPSDPWGNRYRYSLDGDRPVVTSMGPDGLPGTEDDLSTNDLALRASR